MKISSDIGNQFLERSSSLVTPKVRRLKPGGGKHCHCRASLGLFSPKQVVWRVGQPHPYPELRRRSRQHPDELTTEDRSRALPCAEEAIGPQRHGGRGEGQRTGPEEVVLLGPCPSGPRGPCDTSGRGRVTWPLSQAPREASAGPALG